MLVAFGDTPKPQPPVLPQNRQVELLGATVGLDRLLMAGIVIAAAAVLAALYRWSRFGLATRAASEDEVSATLAGLSPNSLSMINTVLACLVAGGLGVLAASITVLYWQTLPLYIVPALAAALFARFTSFGIACTVGLLLGMAQSVLLYYIAPKSVVSDRPRHRAPRRVGPVRVPRHRGRDVLARCEPSRARRADRETTAVRSPVRTRGTQRARRGR